ncbi:hypothetical protein [Desulfohalovibrio reitneri]|uniref:hypothetical protein n=1 Tax=Desulfohalovibrio reitneri TaxID=1307759 RepID=UPI0004A776B3|nr:hypothetical protein [Desulfohalovibrio reitneri]
MFENIDDITVNYEENGEQLVEELDKVVLTRGAWTTILFRFRQYEAKLDGFGPDKYAIRRYRKMGGTFKPQSKFIISNAKQANLIAETLHKWAAEAGEE